MTKLVRVIVPILGLLSMLAALTGTASATWTNTGDTSFTATAGAMTFTTGDATLSCTSARMTATAGTSATTPVWINAMTGNFTTSGCMLGGVSFPWACSYRFDATTKSGGTTLGVFSVSCTISGTTCTVSGSTANTRYTNPVSPATGMLTVPASTSWTMGGTNCYYGSGVMRVTQLTFRITAAAGGPAPNLGPVIV